MAPFLRPGVGHTPRKHGSGHVEYQNSVPRLSALPVCASLTPIEKVAYQVFSNVPRGPQLLSQVCTPGDSGETLYA